ncbi:MAG: prepilin-type N-terminal cleavage/methylation domain-containing protein [Gammaproteobacteria bacterium]|nr:prepilin-type N-terminal cleavage/methylation domain-containing protein [Gammaproteobacteria bacterium]
MNRLHQRSFGSTGVHGFTLIETLLALLLFTLILTMGYQSIVSASQARKLVVENVDRQHALRITHRTLGQAISSNGLLSGDLTHLEINLRGATSGWLPDNRSITLSINSQGQLLARLDEQQYSEILLDGLYQAQFNYLEDQISHASWNKKIQPHLVELSWFEKGAHNNWKFLVQP